MKLQAKVAIGLGTDRAGYRSMLRTMLVLLVLLLTSTRLPCTAAEPFIAAQRTDQVWKDFRAAYPFHIQVIALNEPEPDSSRVLLIAEPPPHLSPDYFRDLAHSLGGVFQLKTNRIGYDGWARDALLALPAMDDSLLSATLSQLAFDLYGTTYKADVVQLPVVYPQQNADSLDLSVATADLHRWTLANNATRFEPLYGGAPRSLKTILSCKQSGVFFSTSAGLVVWSLARHEDLSKSQAEARQFFLDADLILGAVANDDQLAIIGRERVEPVLRLPPLRTEMALLLASEEADELAQSYERNHLFAGTLDDGQDWAPIYLSNTLINSEFGSLLNITDQMLKSWSRNGAVRYYNFEYPNPESWPAFEEPLKEVLEKWGEIVYNWNTEGAGYETSINGYDYMALHRTGALPLIYRVNEVIPVKEHEKIAYEYFAEIGNPDLARVVQYTALYQIFHYFGITTAEAPPDESLQAGIDVLTEQALGLLQRIRSLSPQDLASVAERSAEKSFRHVKTAVESGELDHQEIETRLREDPDSFKRRMFESTKEIFENLVVTLNKGETNWPGTASQTLARMIAAPRDNAPDLTEPVTSGTCRLPTRKQTVWVVCTYRALTNAQYSLTELYDIGQTKKLYTQAFPDKPTGWIKTSSIVLSEDTSSILITGGHNLGARLTRLRRSTNVQPGRVRLVERNGRRVILYHPTDAGKIHRLSRVLAREQGSRTLTRDLNRVVSQPSPPPRPIKTALRIPDRPPEIRGYTPPSSARRSWWSMRRQKADPTEVHSLRAAGTLEADPIIVERTREGYTVMQSGTDKVIEAHTLPSLHDVLGASMYRKATAGRPLKLFLRGFSPEEARGLTLTARARAESKIGRAVDAQTVVMKQNRSIFRNVSQLQNRYDWNRARFEQVGRRKVTEGAYKDYTELSINVEVPAFSGRSLKMRFLAYLQRVTSETAASIRTLVQRAFRTSTSESVETASNLHQILSRVKTDIKTHHPGAKVEMMFPEEVQDVIFGDFLPQDRNRMEMPYGYASP